MRDKPDICSYDYPGQSLSCWDDCCKAYCKQCSFYIRGAVGGDENIVDKRVVTGDGKTKAICTTDYDECGNVYNENM